MTDFTEIRVNTRKPRNKEYLGIKNFVTLLTEERYIFPYNGWKTAVCEQHQVFEKKLTSPVRN
jgi:hypothetical protein